MHLPSAWAESLCQGTYPPPFTVVCQRNMAFLQRECAKSASQGIYPLPFITVCLRNIVFQVHGWRVPPSTYINIMVKSELTVGSTAFHQALHHIMQITMVDSVTSHNTSKISSRGHDSSHALSSHSSEYALQSGSTHKGMPLVPWLGALLPVLLFCQLWGTTT